MKPHPSLLNILSPAYPCAMLKICPQALFDPSKGHIPRGFLGATGEIEDIQAIFVLSEPGHPYYDEQYPENSTPEYYIEAATNTAYQSNRDEKDLIHRNLRWVLDQIWPEQFEAQLKRVWITEGRLCSIENEIGGLNDRHCSAHYLTAQINAIPHVPIVAFGRKAQHRVKQVKGIQNRTVLKAWALSPPGCNRPQAQLSWVEVINSLRSINSDIR